MWTPMLWLLLLWGESFVAEDSVKPQGEPIVVAEDRSVPRGAPGR